ncbi:MAG: hypothetical protein ACM3TT_08110 [Syntrophothermus sp.]
MVCRDCKTVNFSGDAYCRKCGADLWRKANANDEPKKTLWQKVIGRATYLHS